jgi:IclR family acetate operon transcriptional repressor
MSEIRSTERASGSVQSVSRAADLLLCFTEVDRALTLTELAHRTHLNVSTALRILRTLCASGLLARAEDSEGYTTGPALLRLGRAAFVAAGLEPAADLLRQLALETQESNGLGIRDGLNLRMLVSNDSPAPLRFVRPAGTEVPLHASAGGKVLLAFGPVPIPEAVAQLGRLSGFTPKTITSSRKLVAELKAVRQRGWAEANEELYVGVRSVAAPVFDQDGVARAEVATQAPLARMSDQRLNELSVRVREMAAEIAKTLRLPPLLH